MLSNILILHLFIGSLFASSLPSLPSCGRQLDNEDLKRKKPRCPSSSSSSWPCCCPESAYDEVRFLQEKFEKSLLYCNYQTAAALTSQCFSFSTIESDCDPTTCCLLQGNFDAFRSRYQCNDQISVLIPEVQYMKHYSNGTVVVQKLVVNVKADDSKDMSAYIYNYHWSPDCKCKYQLTYIDGNNIKCDSYIPDLIYCKSCVFWAQAQAQALMSNFQAAWNTCDNSVVNYLWPDQYTMGSLVPPDCINPAACCLSNNNYVDSVDFLQVFCATSAPLTFDTPQLVSQTSTRLVYSTTLTNGFATVYPFDYVIVWDPILLQWYIGSTVIRYSLCPDPLDSYPLCDVICPIK